MTRQTSKVIEPKANHDSLRCTRGNPPCTRGSLEEFCAPTHTYVLNRRGRLAEQGVHGFRNCAFYKQQRLNEHASCARGQKWRTRRSVHVAEDTSALCPAEEGRERDQRSGNLRNFEVHFPVSALQSGRRRMFVCILTVSQRENRRNRLRLPRSLGPSGHTLHFGRKKRGNKREGT